MDEYATTTTHEYKIPSGWVTYIVSMMGRTSYLDDRGRICQRVDISLKDGRKLKDQVIINGTTFKSDDELEPSDIEDVLLKDLD